MKNILLLSVFLYLLTPVFSQSKTGFEEWSLDDSLTSFIPFEQLTFHNDSVYSVWISGDSLVYSIYKRSRTKLTLYYLEETGLSCYNKRKNKCYLKYNYTTENRVLIRCAQSRRQRCFYKVSFSD
jgi:hypothetical protein